MFLDGAVNTGRVLQVFYIVYDHMRQIWYKVGRDS